MAKYFTSFYPLCCTSAGAKAINKYHLPPYIDGSCRREPDFERDIPAITGLCRPGFSKKLEIGDIIVYSTNKKLLGEKKLVAILEVIEKAESHQDAAAWYERNGRELPNNIIVNRTQAFALDKTHQMGRWDSWVECHDNLDNWDKQYRERAENYPEVAICKIWKGIRELVKPRSITDDNLKMIFNRIPGTQTPPVYTDDEWHRFLVWLALPSHTKQET